MPVHSVTVKQQAEEAVCRVLLPDERIVAGALAETGPSRRLAGRAYKLAIPLMLGIVLTVLGSHPRPLLGELAASVAVALVVAAAGFLYRSVYVASVYVAATDRRLICCRLSAFRGTPGRLAFAAPLADVSIVDHQSDRSSSSMRCEIRGQQGIRLNVRRPGWRDFADVGAVLRHSAAVTEWDPPAYPSVANS
jgi:hypothetical protein